jgi:6-phosphofructokinase 1
MNAAVRAVVRAGIHYQLEVYGIKQAFKGMIEGDIERMTSRSVSGILKQGGTVLQTARLPEFKEESYQRKALRRLNEHSIDGLIVIGGDGSLGGALALHERGMKVVGIPASIDNDIWGTASSIGVDTATNTIVEAIDRLRDTATSHERVFLVEVMGRNCGYLAVTSGLVTGAEVVITPEQKITLDDVAKAVEDAYITGKSHALVIVAEGAMINCWNIEEMLNKHDIGFEVRVTILGHIQRGGSPSAFDRLLATRMGVSAVEHLLEGASGDMMALEGTSIVPLSLKDILGRPRPLNPQYTKLTEILS